MSLRTIQAFIDRCINLIDAGQYHVTGKAEFEAELEDLYEEDILDVVRDLTAADFYKSYGVAQDMHAFVTFTEHSEDEFYVKLTIDTRGCVVVSFHPTFE